jgi:cysteine desulfurase
VVRITSGFQQESPLHPSAKKVLDQLFDRGWPDTKKINQSSREAAILLYEAKNTFAKFLNLRVDEIEFIGEVNLGFHLAITGLLKPDSKLIISEIDKQNIFAVKNSWENAGRQSHIMKVNAVGQSQEGSFAEKDLLVWQVANGETGIIQDSPKSNSMIFADCTASGVDYLPDFDYQTALFDSKSWQGPNGIGILVIKNGAQWINPLPHNDYIRTPNTYSLPLALASAVALESYVLERGKVNGFKDQLIDQLKISQLEFIAPIGENNLAKFLTLIFANVEADRLVLELQDAGFAVDSGSACRAADMQPSHVLAAMGLPTAGGIRITFHPQINSNDVTDLGNAIISSVRKLTN